MGLIGKTMGLTKDTIGLGKSMNGAQFTCILLEVCILPVFSSRKWATLLRFSTLKLRSDDKVE